MSWLNLLLLILSLVAIFLGVVAIIYSHKEYTMFIFRNARKSLEVNRREMVSISFNYYKEKGYVNDEVYTVNGKDFKLKMIFRNEWVPTDPLPLEAIDSDGAQPLIILDQEMKWGVDRSLMKKEKRLMPNSYLFRKFNSYSDAISFIEDYNISYDRPTFCIGEVDDKIHCRICNYRDFFDSSEILAFETAFYHEKIMRKRSIQHSVVYGGGSNFPSIGKMPIRDHVGSPFNFSGHASEIGISTITIFEDNGKFRFILHYRNPKKVAQGKGFVHVVPAGEFESQGISNVTRDFKIWRNIMREYNEELQHAPEIYFGEDYINNPPFNILEEERKKGNVKCYYFGLAIDPTNLKPQIATACVFHNGCFRRIFRHLDIYDEEGEVLFGDKDYSGIPFTRENIEFLLNDKEDKLSETGRFILILTLKNMERILQ